MAVSKMISLVMLALFALNAKLEAKEGATEPHGVSPTANSATTDSDNSSVIVFPVEDPRHCRDDVKVLQVLPGHGWDNLQSKVVSSIVQFNYSQCRKSADGLLIIPDGVTAEFHPASDNHLMTVIFETMDEYYPVGTKTLTHDSTLSVNDTISSSFSSAYKTAKTQQVLSDAVTVRTQYEDKRYDVVLDSTMPPFTTEFTAAVEDIASALSDSDQQLAQYYADSLVGKFGTHFITSVYAGGMVSKEDSIKASVLKKGEIAEEMLKIAAKAVFQHQFEGKEVNADSKAIVTTYENATVSSSTTSFGGFVLDPFHINDWKTSVDNNMAAVGQLGISVAGIVTAENFPNISSLYLHDVAEEVNKSINRYYARNTHFGCTDRKSPNFVFAANKDDGTCQGPSNNYSFGGMYQTCKRLDQAEDYENYCHKLGLRRTNPVTRELKCPKGYEPELLSVNLVKKDIRTCEDRCTDLLDCFDWCPREPVYFVYDLYWCAAQESVTSGSGAAFGGLYSSKRVNPVTGGTSCPAYFTAINLHDMHVCMSQDPEAAQLAVPFGGFFSSVSGNPFVESQGKHRCPVGYSQHAASTDVSYCIAAGNVTNLNLPILVKPPYTDKPTNSTSNAMTFVVYEANGIIFYRDSLTGPFKNATTVEELQAAGLEGLISYFLPNGSSQMFIHHSSKHTEAVSGGGLSGGAVAGIVVGVLVVVAAIGAAAYVYGKKRSQSRQRTNSRSHLTSSENAPRDYSSSQRSNEPTESQPENNVNDVEHSQA